MKFIAFTEINDHEGETWKFWLQLDGNHEKLIKLKKILEDYFGYEYSLDFTPVEESEVDILVKNAKHDGYFPEHNKTTGLMDLYKLEKDLKDENNDPFYKGGIRNYF